MQAGALQVGRGDGSPANIRFSASGNNWLFINNPNVDAFAIRNETDSRSPFRIAKNAEHQLLSLQDDNINVNPCAGQGLSRNIPLACVLHANG